MYSLGIHIGHDAGVSLVSDGVLVNSICEERLNRVKHWGWTNELPKLSLDYILSASNLNLSDIDYTTFSICTQYDKIKEEEELFEELSKYCKIDECISHHTAHSISTYDFFGLEEEAVSLVVDMGGSIEYVDGEKKFIEAHSIFDINKNKNERIYSQMCNWKDTDDGASLGHFYEEPGMRIGIGVFNSCSGKMMGYSAYGNMDRVNQKYPEDWIIVPEDLDDEIWVPHIVNNKIKDKFIINSWEDEADLALKIQKEFERAIFFLVKKAKHLKKCDTLVLAGGCFLNSIVNQKIIDSKIFDNIYIIPSTDDSGISIGCAFNGYRKLL